MTTPQSISTKNQFRKGFLGLVLLLLSLFSFSSYNSTLVQAAQKRTTELPVENAYKRNQNNTVSYFSKKNSKRSIPGDKLFYAKIAAAHRLIFQVELAANERKILNIKSIGPAQLKSHNIYSAEKSPLPDNSQG
jgi:hypothetical protein